ncbi:MAG: hypothetical protein ACI8P9_001671 [Parasphingorhabdus sp.]
MKNRKVQFNERNITTADPIFHSAPVAWLSGDRHSLQNKQGKAYEEMMKTIYMSLMLLASSLVSWQIAMAADSSPDGAKAYIVSPTDGATVISPITVVFGLQGMGVSPAGVNQPGTGHHHLLVDAQEIPDLNQPLGSSVKHFGKGQTQVILELAPGDHSLQLILGNYLHMPHDPAVVSEKIFIIVTE